MTISQKLRILKTARCSLQPSPEKCMTLFLRCSWGSQGRADGRDIEWVHLWPWQLPGTWGCPQLGPGTKGACWASEFNLLWSELICPKSSSDGFAGRWDCWITSHEATPCITAGGFCCNLSSGGGSLGFLPFPSALNTQYLSLCPPQEGSTVLRAQRPQAAKWNRKITPSLPHNQDSASAERSPAEIEGLVQSRLHTHQERKRACTGLTPWLTLKGEVPCSRPASVSPVPRELVTPPGVLWCSRDGCWADTASYL